MAFPLLGLGLLLSGGSAIANTIAANKVNAARESAMAAERIRQQRLDQEADARNAGARDRYQNFEEQQGEKSTKLGDYFKGAAAAPADAGEANASAGAAMPSTGGGDDIVTREMGKQSDLAKSFTDQQAASLGQLRSFGDLMGDVGRLQQRDASAIDQIGGFKRGSSGVLPLELEAAASKGQGMQFLGDILGGLGGIATTAGIMGGSLGGLGGLFGGTAPTTLAPATSIRPMARPLGLGASAYGGVY